MLARLLSRGLAGKELWIFLNTLVLFNNGRRVMMRLGRCTLHRDAFLTIYRPVSIAVLPISRLNLVREFFSTRWIFLTMYRPASNAVFNNGRRIMMRLRCCYTLHRDTFLTIYCPALNTVFNNGRQVMMSLRCCTLHSTEMHFWQQIVWCQMLSCPSVLSILFVNFSQPFSSFQ